MNRAKKAIESLKHYLGKDTQGLSLLGKVAESVNVLRRQLRQANEDREKYARLYEDGRRLREEAMEAIKASRREAEGLIAQQKALERKIKDEKLRCEEAERKYQDLVERLNADIPESTPSVEFFTAASINQVYRDIRPSMPYCPAAQWKSGKRGNQVATVKFSQVIKDFSTSELLKLGRFVVLKSLFNVDVHIEHAVNHDDVFGDHGSGLSVWFTKKNITAVHGREDKYYFGKKNSQIIRQDRRRACEKCGARLT